MAPFTRAGIYFTHILISKVKYDVNILKLYRFIYSYILTMHISNFPFYFKEKSPLNLITIERKRW